MPTWDEICQVLEELQTLILEIQIELACEATWEEIMDKYGNRPHCG